MPAAAEGDGPDPISEGGADTIHASAVALDGRGLLILGAAGSGKSALALELMARGARLVSDDQVALSVEGGRLIARAPAAIRGRIETKLGARFESDDFAFTIDHRVFALDDPRAADYEKQIEGIARHIEDRNRSGEET